MRHEVGLIQSSLEDLLDVGAANEHGRKHKKRHTRPYGCTFDGCTWKFGSKNDWKRHENTQHYQTETWRCHEYSPTSQIKQCATLFYRREQYQAHLRDKHKIENDEQIREKCKSHRIGRNGQNGFWCGFCKKIVDLKSKGLDAWDERFGHIDDSHYKRGQTINEWVPMNCDIPKGMLGKGDLIESAAKEVGNDNENNEEGMGSCSSSSSDPETLSGLDDQSSLAMSGSKPMAYGGHQSSRQRTFLWYCVSDHFE